MGLVNKFSAVVLLALIFATDISFALTPPPPNASKITLYDSPMGFSIILLGSFDYSNHKYSFYGADKLFRLSLLTTLPVAEKQIKFEYEHKNKYICTGTALITASEYQDSDVVRFDKLTAKLTSSSCKWTDGLNHPAVVIVLSGLLEIKNTTVTEITVPSGCIDLQLENTALQTEIEKLLQEKARLLERDTALESCPSLQALNTEISALKAELEVLTNQKSSLEAILSDINKAFAKARLNNINSLKALYNQIKRIRSGNKIS